MTCPLICVAIDLMGPISVVDLEVSEIATPQSQSGVSLPDDSTGILDIITEGTPSSSIESPPSLPSNPEPRPSRQAAIDCAWRRGENLFFMSYELWYSDKLFFMS